MRICKGCGEEFKENQIDDEVCDMCFNAIIEANEALEAENIRFWEQEARRNFYEMFGG